MTPVQFDQVIIQIYPLSRVGYKIPDKSGVLFFPKKATIIRTQVLAFGV
jgi:hypothetical protein